MYWYLVITVFFFLLFGCPTANFGPLSRWRPHLSDVNHCVLSGVYAKVTGNVVRTSYTLRQCFLDLAKIYFRKIKNKNTFLARWTILWSLGWYLPKSRGLIILIFQSFYWCQLQDIFESLQLLFCVLVLKKVAIINIGVINFVWFWNNCWKDLQLLKWNTFWANKFQIVTFKISLS